MVALVFTAALIGCVIMKSQLVVDLIRMVRMGCILMPVPVLLHASEAVSSGIGVPSAMLVVE